MMVSLAVGRHQCRAETRPVPAHSARAGLAGATAVGAWINLVLLAIFAIRRGSMKPDLVLWKTAACVSTASCALAFFALLAAYPAQRLAAHFGRLNHVMELLLLGAGGALVYGALMIAGLRIAGVELRRSARAKAKATEPPYGWYEVPWPASQRQRVQHPRPAARALVERDSVRISRSANGCDRPRGRSRSSACPCSRSRLEIADDRDRAAAAGEHRLRRPIPPAAPGARATAPPS